MVSSDEKRNPKRYLIKKKTHGRKRKRRIRSRILQHEGVSQPYLLRTLSIIPRVRPLSRGRAKRRTGPNRINQEERSRRL
ncbi:hypothetical protein CEXT_699021 [Caerostris extrusa]|uniref:Uncharacterized protein n=1 Tax=Caerostris extrusa TaxID=172846 RepID=A0AAV4VUS3_CAEEX|nr:hypothetical protein CEXT_699021 [Caerostris extrusa]